MWLIAHSKLNLNTEYYCITMTEKFSITALLPTGFHL